MICSKCNKEIYLYYGEDTCLECSPKKGESYRELKNKTKLFSVLFNPIRPVTIHRYEDFDYVRISELPEYVRHPFTKWLEGQTRPVIPDLEPQDAVFSWDWERYLTKLEKGIEIWD